MKRILAFLFLFIFWGNNASIAQENSGEVFVNVSFAHSMAKVDGFSFDIDTIGLGLEKRFEDNHFFILSGWEIGYERELHKASGGSYGHYIKGKIVFREFSLGHFSILARGGALIGRPTALWFQTVYADGTKHIGIKTHSIEQYGSFVFYPFAEIEFEKSWKRLSFGVGTRISFVDFGISRYGNNTGEYRGKVGIIPAFFGEIGIRPF